MTSFQATAICLHYWRVTAAKYLFIQKFNEEKHAKTFKSSDLVPGYSAEALL